MLLKNKHNKTQYWVMYLTMAIAHRHKDEVSFYLNSKRMSGYLATKGIKISQQKVSKFLSIMVANGYLYFVGAENMAYRVTEDNKYKVSNLYGLPDLQAMSDDLHQYSLKYWKELQLSIEDYIKHPHYLEDTYDRYSAYCDEVREDEERDDKLAMLREHPVHQQYEALVAECNAFVTDDFLTICYAGDDKLRASSKLCPTPNPESHLKDTDDNYGDLTRFEHLAGYFGTERVGNTIDDTICKQFGIQEIDVKASIYRLTYNLTHSETLDPSIDLYEQFYYYCPSLKKGFRDDVSDVWLEVTGKSETKTVRDLVKDLSMPLYMRAGSRKNSCDKYGTEWAIAVECNGKIKPDDRNRYYNYRALEKVFGISIYQIVDEWCFAMRKVLGVTRFLQDKIFWYESDLYIAMVKEFRSRGIKTANVYDGFYFKAGTITKEEFYEVYDACLTELKAKIKELAPEDTAKLTKPVTKITEKKTDDGVYRIREKVEVQQVAIVTDVPTTKTSYCEGLPLLGMSNLPVMQKVKDWV